MLLGNFDGCRENTMIGFIFAESFFHTFVQWTINDDRQSPQVRPQLSSVLKKIFIGVFVELAGKFPGIVIDFFISFFEFIQLFQYDYRDKNIILLKIENTFVIMKENICV